MTRDVVIVGAGPAGSSAAASLARRGRDVVLVDRCAFPRDKACGDGVPPGTIELLNRLGMSEKIRDAGFYPIRGIRLGSPRGRIWETRFEARRAGAQFCIAPRVEFDALLCAHAVASGAELVRGSVTGVVVDGGRAVGVRLRDHDDGERTIDARVVIGADGATSVVARSLGVVKPQPAHRGVSMRAYLDGVDILPHTVEFYFHRRFLPGYAWVFPLGAGRANVGVIVRADRFKDDDASLRDLLDEFLGMPGLCGRMGARVESSSATWQLPYAVEPPPPRVFDGALLIGDAGRFVDSLTGEGIHNAVQTAVIAADVVDGALAGGDTSRATLGAYDERCRDVLGPMIARSYAYHRRIAGSAPAIESLFVIANAGRGAFRSWLNHVSTDFVIHA